MVRLCSSGVNKTNENVVDFFKEDLRSKKNGLSQLEIARFRLNLNANYFVTITFCLTD